MEIKRDYDLTGLNTLAVVAKAKFFVVLEKASDIVELFSRSEFKGNKRFFLGGGSNVLFLNDFDGIVVQNKLKGIDIISEDDVSVRVKMMGGEDWHEAVLFCVNKNYWGIENLSLVPGSVGAAPIQNIGAYGTELKDTLESVEVYDVESGEKKILALSECKFGYRDSIFKNSAKGKCLISAINLKLSKIPKPNISYKILKDYLEKNNISSPSLKEISDAVCQIRRSKLPDPKVIPNAGSFFKNLLVDSAVIGSLKEKYPDMPTFKDDSGVTKISTAWLIEQCGWKGKREGRVGMHERQALVLVNYGGATGEEIIAFAKKIIASVEEKFKLAIVPEVNIIE